MQGRKGMRVKSLRMLKVQMRRKGMEVEAGIGAAVAEGDREVERVKRWKSRRS